jgi:hypothetical protein
MMFRFIGIVLVVVVVVVVGSVDLYIHYREMCRRGVCTQYSVGCTHVKLD